MHKLLKRFAGRLALTLALVVLEAAGWTLFPLAIGRAIDGVLADSPHGLYELAGLGIVAMGIGIARRIVDSRAYARIYARLGEELVEQQSETGTSTTTARLGCSGRSSSSSRTPCPGSSPASSDSPGRSSSCQP